MNSARRAAGDELQLATLAAAAQKNAYAPYSGFSVGAALRTTTGQLVTAANVENASYGLTICAERAAVARAVAQGLLPRTGPQTTPDAPPRIAAIAVAASETPAAPCGACRQVLAEFAAPDMRVIYPATDELRSVALAELLPEQFHLGHAT
jgi:homotetrameric cytidine deaminase